MKIKIFTLAMAVFFSSAVMASDIQLETIGASAGSNLYLTYLSIGVIADAHTKEVYDAAKTISFTGSIVAQAKVQKDYLNKLIKSKEVSESDEAFLKKMIDCYTLLIDEGNSLVDYVNTGKEASLKTYDTKRQQAWTLISEILGFNQ